MTYKHPTVSLGVQVHRQNSFFFPHLMIIAIPPTWSTFILDFGTPFFNPRPLFFTNKTLTQISNIQPLFELQHLKMGVRDLWLVFSSLEPSIFYIHNKVLLY